MTDVIIYTDGSSSPADHSGGWAALLLASDREKVVTGAIADTTNQQMELMAAIGGLAALKRTRRWKVKLYSDSRYLIEGFNSGWLVRWQANGWLNYRNKPVANQALWEVLEQLAVIFDVEFEHVKGHAGHPINERVDRLASEARRLGIAERNQDHTGQVQSEGRRGSSGTVFVCKR